MVDRSVKEGVVASIDDTQIIFEEKTSSGSKTPIPLFTIWKMIYSNGFEEEFNQPLPENLIVTSNSKEFSSASTDVFEYAQEIDSAVESDKGRNFKFGVRLGVNASYLNFGKSGIFEVSEDAKLGGSFGFRLDWKITDYNRIRVEPYYFFQQFDNRFEEEDLVILSTFQNHGVGMDVFPLVLQIGGKVKPTVSLGGFFNYILSSSSKSQINGRPANYEFSNLEKLQGGIVAGTGIYVGKSLLEMRFYHAITDLFSGIETPNRVNHVSFIIAF